MGRLPYRSSAVVARAVAEASCPDGDLVAPFLVFWAGSIVRIALAVAHGERAGREVTLAVLVVIAVPLLLRRAVAWSTRRLRESVRSLRGRAARL